MKHILQSNARVIAVLVVLAPFAYGAVRLVALYNEAVGK
jgi:hypothetical protein